jgi:hypothetical protein
MAEHRIHTGDARPVRLPAYRLPQAYHEDVQKELDQMLKEGIIEKSTSEWAFPIVLVKKNDGTWRMCDDFRRLNSVAQGDAYPMPRIDDLIDGLGQAKYVSTLGLTKGYWKMPVAADDRDKTSFTYTLWSIPVQSNALRSQRCTCFFPTNDGSHSRNFHLPTWMMW